MREHYFRSGPPQHDPQQPLSFIDVRRRFDFASIRIGRWVTTPEQQRAAGYFYDALCDLMEILHVPESVISLRGSLSLDYGTGGRPGVAAHYIPAQRVFALAKNAGPGSIAHEWFHAFDHYIASHAFVSPPADRFGSFAWLHDAEIVDHPLNQSLYAVFRCVLLDEAGTDASELMERSMMLDKRQGSLYFSLPEEACARAFEAFVQDAPLKNHFLVSGTRQSQLAQAWAYPEGSQRERINASFRHYFKCLGQALNSKR